MSQSALIVSVRTPEPGTIKSRLATTTGIDSATHLQEASDVDSLRPLEALTVPVRLYVTGSSEHFSQE